MERSQGIYAVILDYSVITFSMFTLYCYGGVLFNQDFASLIRYLPFLVALIMVPLFLYQRQSVVGDDEGASTSGFNFKAVSAGGKSTVTALFLAGLTAYVFSSGHSYFIFYAIGLAYVAYTSFYPPERTGVTCSQGTRGDDHLPIVVFAILVSTITLFAHRPDQDDAQYLGTVIATLDTPGLPLLSFDGMHGEAGLPFLAGIYRIHSYEILVATVSRITGLAPDNAYYMIFPALSAVLVVIVNYLALQQIAGRWAVFGLFLTLVVWLAWGGSHRSYGNFSFVRLFQGKGILVAICIPAVFYYAFRYISTHRLRDWFMLGLVQITAVGVSSTGLVVAPLASILVLTASWNPLRKNTLQFMKGACSSVFLVAPLLIILHGTMLRPYVDNSISHGSELDQQVEAASNTVLPRQLLSSIGLIAEQGLTMVIGQGTRAWLAIFCLLLGLRLALQSSIRNAPVLHRYLLLIWLVVFNPLTIYLFYLFLADNFSWRIFWAVPIPLLIGITGALVLEAGYSTSGGKTTFHFLCYFLIIFFFVTAGPWTLSSENRTKIHSPSRKIPPSQYAVAEFIVSRTPEDGMVLAPWQISWILPLFSHHPRLVAVRPHYLHILKFKYGEEEVRRRQRVMRYIVGAPGAAQYSSEFNQFLQQQKIFTVVFANNVPWSNDLSEKLQTLGYRKHILGAFQVWLLRETES